MKTTEDLLNMLSAWEIFPEIHHHDPVLTVAEANEKIPLPDATRCKNLFVRNRAGNKYFLVVARDSLAINLKTLGKDLGTSRLGLASPERLLLHLGLIPGSVGILALVNDPAHNIKLIMDQSLMTAEKLTSHPLINTQSWVLTKDDLKNFLQRLNRQPIFI